MLQLLRTVAGLALPDSRCRLKLAVRGGILRVTGGELSVGMGLFGSRDVRRVPLAAITSIHAAEGLTPTAGVTLHILAGSEELRIVGLSPLSARRLRAILQIVQGPAQRCCNDLQALSSSSEHKGVSNGRSQRPH